MRDSRGDTIVEVLISIAVASFVVGGAYTVVNRSLKYTQQAQEHSEALLIANTQIELIHHYLRVTDKPTIDTNIYSNGTKFHCFNPTTAKLEHLGNITSLPDPIVSHYDDPATSGPDCDKTGSVDFRVAFEYVPGATHVNDVYRVHVNWPSISGHGDDQVTVAYKAAL